MVVQRDLGEPAGLQLGERHEQAAVVGGDHFHVVGGAGAEAMAVHAHGTVVAIDPDIVEGVAVLRPHDAAGRLGDEVGQVDLACDIADVDR